MTECMVTASQKMCQCIIARIPADQRANAILGLRKSNQSVSVERQPAQSVEPLAAGDAGPERRRRGAGLLHVA